MEICKYKDFNGTYTFYGYRGTAPETELKIFEVDAKNEIVDCYNDHEVMRIQDFDDRGREADKILLSDLRKIELHFLDGGSPDVDIIHKDDVETYIKAKLELHFSPGINPYVTDRDNKTSELSYIRVSEFKNQGAFWHTTPGLGKNFDEKGVQCFHAWGSELKWKNPKLPDLA
ncbi:hypothetical protein EVB81_165 [Rhizobium phage RHph_I46]|uniref:Uncharacterized protein n=1 Tax=Rhizobium phage RHph_I1_9 TaxID=2509729 RepID=A0A7S5R9I4_9CAUD|nr:hypothetical protein PP936_gp164 [Rhizobium phage RHph_I1_9]QIG69734.1 hypothetical protein EVB81_165 [Rhizobium phage RHph_I46]QIG71015.1 hypothetical protein EVB92_165 [Rhizobium phage RHph_I9]QIG73601.1 hypothetical protein EVC04_164 [Rhizobium phage RHph_I1_9]QIG76354.1 hypothetical protein EVC25_165 [Rhizobium phage RHph_I34]